MQDPSSDILNQAAALLVDRGFTREWAEELLKAQSYGAHPDNADDWVKQILGSQTDNGDKKERQQALDEHHREGIPPYEPPVRD